MHQHLCTALDQLLAGNSLTAEQMQCAIGAIMDGECSAAGIASLLTALAIKGETSTEVAGAAQAMRARSSKITTLRTGLIDTCGTGGDKLHTFNISTATAFVVAAAGLPVAKHGNRSVSSSSGSADVLERLGVNIELSAEHASQCLDDIGICFCYARLFHGAMKHVAPVRADLGFRTIFNLLGPLTNPANAEFQLLGTNSNQSAEKLAEAARQLGMQRAMIVCGNNQLDEVSLWGETRVWDVQSESVNRLTWTAADFGLPECAPEDLTVSTPEESAAVIKNILIGKHSPHRNIVLANAAAALVCAGKADSPKHGTELAMAAIDNGAAQQVLRQLIAWSQTR